MQVSRAARAGGVAATVTATELSLSGSDIAPAIPVHLCASVMIAASNILEHNCCVM
jgi:hypothetical protein